MVHLTKVTFDGRNVPIRSGYLLEKDRRRAPRDPLAALFPVLLVVTLAEPFLFGRESRPTEAVAEDGRTVTGLAFGLFETETPAGKSVSLHFSDPPTWIDPPR